MTREIELAKKCGVRYFSTPEGTREMWCYDRDLQAFADALIAQERKACAAVCARLRIATGERIGESDPATEAWNKALRDAERFITERSNAPDQATDAAFCAGQIDRRVMPGATTKKGNGNGNG